MCGIFGFIDTPWNQEVKAYVFDAILSRGPDEQDSWEKDDVLVGHTRLSIIDVESGHQPMVSNDGRYVLVFNGEIYNFKHLRSSLQKLGHVFNTESDTEVVLVGFMEWGNALPVYLDGMFAFSIWDNKEKKAFCARDRVGIKPFFYSTTKGFSFSSSLKSFIDIIGFPKELDYQALRDFLAFQTCMAPHSFLKNVNQLPPASKLTWSYDTNIIEINQYWSPSEIDNSIDRHSVIDAVDRVLEESVKSQLMSDVPLGAFLSGGVDSSLMVHYMNKAGVSPIDVFTLQFSQDKYNETPFAKEVAQHFGCNHHILDSPEIDGYSWLESIKSLDQPLGDPAYVVTNSLSKLTRKHVTVSISGDGGDELFAGYKRFQRQASDFPNQLRQKLLRPILDVGLLPSMLVKQSLSEKEMMLYQHVELGPWAVGRKSLYKYLNSDIYEYAQIEKTLNLWRNLAGDMKTKDLMRADLWTYLSENCLTKTDRASMANSLEVRVPMLGNDVLDLATSIPIEHHFDKLGGKRILRELSKRYLPESTWNRKKHGLSVPLQDLFNSSWGEPIDDLVNRCHEIAPFLNAKSVKGLWVDAKRNKGAKRLSYSFAVLLAWLDANGL